MPITAEFDYARPGSLDEALRLLAGAGAKARVLAGGTDLIVQLKEDVCAPALVVDIKSLPGLGGIRLRDQVLSIGSLVTFSGIAESPLIRERCPLLAEAALTVASSGVRNRATLAGNICSAVPSADSAPALAVYDAVVSVRGARGPRRISIHDWFAGPRRTALAPGELVLGVDLTLPRVKAGGCYAKMSRYEGEDLAQGGLAALALADGSFRVAVCALGPKPSRCRAAEAALSAAGGRGARGLAAASEALLGEISPITDMRSTAEYRRHMAKVMLGRALAAASSRLAGRGPEYGERVI